MRTLEFTVLIDASPSTVWNTMLQDKTYRLWTAAFTEGSHFVGSWEQGARIQFLDPKGGGMTAVIAENRPYEYISIKMLGYIENGVEDTESEAIRAWAPAYENYTFTPRGASTELRIDVQVTPDFVDYMQDTYPRALEILKSLCEQSGS